MPTKVEVLKTETYKDDEDELEARIYYTLMDKKEIQIHRISKFVSLTVKMLHEKEILNDDEIDELLFDCLG